MRAAFWVLPAFGALGLAGGLAALALDGAAPGAVSVELLLLPLLTLPVAEPACRAAGAVLFLLTIPTRNRPPPEDAA